MSDIGASVFNSANEPIPDSVQTDVTFDSSLYSDGVTFTAGANPITILTAGKYQIDWGILFDAAAGGSLRDSRLLLNGAAINGYAAVGPSTLPFTANGAVELSLSIGDTIGVAVFQNSGGNLNIMAGFPYISLSVRKVAA
jgi:hypothetical protein